MAKWCFLGVCFFEVLILKGLFLVCLVLFQKCLKCLFFPVFWFFLGWLIVVHLGLEGLGVFVFLVFVFFLSCFCFCFVCFVLSFVVGCCCFFLFVFVVFLFLFVFACFFGGFKGHVRWPEGPPHLALNPSYFICFCLFSFVLFSFFVFFFVFLFFRV